MPSLSEFIKLTADHSSESDELGAAADGLYVPTSTTTVMLTMLILTPRIVSRWNFFGR